MVNNFIRRFYLFLFTLQYFVKNLDLKHSSFFVNNQIKVTVFKDKISISEGPLKLICYLFDEIFTKKFLLKIQSLHGIKIHQNRQEQLEIEWKIMTDSVSIHTKLLNVFEEEHETLVAITKQHIKLVRLFENDYTWNFIKNCVERWKQFIVRKKSRKRFYKLLKVVSEHLGNPRFINFKNKMLD